MKVREFITQNPIGITSETLVAEIARILIEHHVNGVPVIGPEKRLLALVTEGDLVHRATAEHLEPRESAWKENFFRSVIHRNAPGTDRAEGRRPSRS